MKNRWFRALCALCALFAQLSFSCALAEELQAGQVDLYIDGKLPAPTLVMAVDFDSSAFDSLVYAALSSQAAEIDVSEFELTPEAFSAAYQDVVNSHPDLFYISNGFGYYSSSSGYVTRVVPEYLYSGEDLQNRIAAFNSHVSRIARYASRASTRVGKLMLANAYFCLNYEYDSSYTVYSPDQLFETGKGVCQAYMLGFQAVLDQLGIPNTPATSDSMNHIWNLVQVDGSWYHIDVTWNDPLGAPPLYVGYDNFLLSHSGIIAAGHNNWVAQVTADNTQYDDFFWIPITAPLPILGNTVYYVTTGEEDYLRTVKAYNLSSGTESVLLTYDITANDGSYSYFGGIDPFWATDTRIYYAAQNILYSVNHQGGDLRAEYVTGSADQWIWRLYLDDGTLRMFIGADPFDEGAVVDFTSQDIRLTLDHALLELNAGESGRLTALLGGMENFAAELTWTSSNASVAAIDENGIVTALTPGLSTVRVELGDTMSAECLVLVHSEDVLELPQDLVSIEADAFKGVAAQEVVLPEGVTAIGAGAFAGCENLLLVNLPASLETIDVSAFDGCNQLTLLCPAGQVGEAYATEYGIPFVTLP